MTEWRTYTLADFLMFAPRTYWRLLELYNGELWPAHFVALTAGCVLLALAGRPGTAARRATAVLLALAWAWVAWGWLHQRFATINWAADYAAAAYALEAVLWASYGWRARALAPLAAAPLLHAGAALAGFAVVAYPFTALLSGRTLGSVEVFGLAHDPTAIATLGVLLGAPAGARIVLLPIPLASCAASAALLWTMREPYWWLPLAAVVVACAVPFLARPASLRH